MITVSELLADPVLRGAECVAGEAAAPRREVSWTSVIHWPAVEFVRPGDFVLTTGVGCDTDTLRTFVAELVESDAAALAVSLPPGRQDGGVDREVLARADQRDFPIIELPWEIRFADVTRRVADALAAAAAWGFLRTVVHTQGPEGVTRTLEQRTGLPALIFDASFRFLSAGGLARSRLGKGGVRSLGERSLELGRDEIAELARLFRPDEPVAFESLPVLGVGAGVASAAVGRDRVLGYVCLLDRGFGESQEPPSALDFPALAYACAALALELLRLETQPDAALDSRAAVLADLVSGCGARREDVVGRADALGLDPGAEYELAVGRDEGGSGRDALERVEQELTRLRIPQLIAVVRSEEIVVAVRSGSTRRRLRELLAACQAGRSLSWGVASGAVALRDLPEAHVEASRVRAIAARVLSPGTVACADEIKPFLLLSSLRDDPLAGEMVLDVVGPLREYDERTGRNLVETLGAYADEGFNTSSAARRLHLNRHSLLYRLRKIESLTGLSLGDANERFLLELGFRLALLEVAREAD